MSDFNPDWASPPWETIRDAAEEKGIPVGVYTAILGLTDSGLEKLKRGDMVIDAYFAGRLSDAIGSTKEFWVNREIRYRESRNRIDAEQITTLQDQLAKAEKVIDAAVILMSFDKGQFIYDKECGNLVNRDKRAVNLLQALHDYKTGG